MVWMRMLHRDLCPVVLLCMAFLLAGTSSYAAEREAEKVGEREDVAMTRAQLRHEIMRFASEKALHTQVFEVINLQRCAAIYASVGWRFESSWAH